MTEISKNQCASYDYFIGGERGGGRDAFILWQALT